MYKWTINLFYIFLILCCWNDVESHLCICDVWQCLILDTVELFSFNLIWSQSKTDSYDSWQIWFGGEEGDNCLTECHTSPKYIYFHITFQERKSDGINIFLKLHIWLHYILQFPLDFVSCHSNIHKVGDKEEGSNHRPLSNSRREGDFFRSGGGSC